MVSKRNKQRTYARNRFITRRGYLKSNESDGVYILKLVAVIVLGSFWIKFHNAGTPGGPFLLGVPIGLIVGLFLVHTFEKSPYDRRIWYAIIIVVTIISCFLPAGIMI